MLLTESFTGMLLTGMLLTGMLLTGMLLTGMLFTDWLGADQFDWIAGGLAVSLLVASFVMIFVTISSRKKRP